MTTQVAERTAHLEGSLEQMDRGLDSIEQDLDGLRSEFNSRFYLTLHWG